MFRCLATHCHFFWMLIETGLHSLEHGLVLPPGDQSFLAGGAAMLDSATLTGVGPVATQDQASVLGREGVGEPLAGRTNVNILHCHVAEVLLAEAPCRL